jgi:hypothetical protein
MGIRKHRVWQELPTITPNSDTKIIVTDNNNQYLGYASVADLQVTVDGNGLATDTDIATLNTRINAVTSSIGVSGSYASQDIYYATNNGNGTNFKVGDDAWIGDINASNVMQVKGVQDATKGYIQFGSGSLMPKIGGGGVNHLNIKNIPTYANNATALAGGLVAGDIYLYTGSDFLAIVH